MRGDFSLMLPDLTDYSLVLMQQGRALVESDWNAAMATLISAQRTLAADLIGPHGGPGGIPGFQPTRVLGAHPDLELNPGVYYVDGIRCELAPGPDGTKPRWSEQPYPISLDAQKPPQMPYLVYLDVWERHVSTVEDENLREVALGGPDTTSRRQIVWQVRTMPMADKPKCDEFDLDAWRAEVRGNVPLMRARTGPPPTDDQPCLASPDARYRGVENQLYRVEIASVADAHVEGSLTSFVWSRENGSVAVPWTGTVDDQLRVAGIRDVRHGFSVGDWVELTWDTLEFAGVGGTRVRLTDVDGAVLTFDPESAVGDVEQAPAGRPHAKVRRWDQRGRKAAPLRGGAVEVIESAGGENGWIPLEDGIEIQFLAPGDADDERSYRVGDYWTIPARVATGDIIWPVEDDGTTRAALPPRGVEHHLAPLAWFSGNSKVFLQRMFGPWASCPSN
jgi:Family of unknown function (DUF6519)